MKYKLLSIFRDLKSTLKLIVVHNTLFKSVIVLGAIDGCILQLLHQVVMSPLVCVLLFLILFIEVCVPFSVLLKALSSEANLIHGLEKYAISVI